MNAAQAVASFRFDDKTRRKINNLKRLRDAGIAVQPFDSSTSWFCGSTAKGSLMVRPETARWKCGEKVGHGINKLRRWLEET